jgi:hypothetical protein
MQAGAGKLGVIEASYASAIIGVLSPVSSHCLVSHSAFGIRHSAFRIPHSAFRIPHSAFRIPHSAKVNQILCSSNRLARKRDHSEAVLPGASG